MIFYNFNFYIDALNFLVFTSSFFFFFFYMLSYNENNLHDNYIYSIKNIVEFLVRM
jgi:hypothetical protein